MVGPRTIVLAALFILGACGGSSPQKAAEKPAAPANPPAKADEAGGGEGADQAAPLGDQDRLIALFQTLAGDLRDAGGCAAFARTLDGFVKEHSEEVRALTAQVESTEGVDEDEAAMFDRRLVDAIEVVLDGADECVDHAQAQAAFDAFDEMLLGG